MKDTSGPSVDAPAPAPAPASASAPAPGATSVEVTDAAATEGETHLDPNHEWPTTGGRFVRQADGTLTRED